MTHCPMAITSCRLSRGYSPVVVVRWAASDQAVTLPFITTTIVGSSIRTCTDGEWYDVRQKAKRYAVPSTRTRKQLCGWISPGRTNSEAPPSLSPTHPRTGTPGPRFRASGRNTQGGQECDGWVGERPRGGPGTSCGTGRGVVVRWWYLTERRVRWSTRSIFGMKAFTRY